MSTSSPTSTVRAPRTARPAHQSSKPNGQWAVDGREPLNGNEAMKAQDDGLNVRIMSINSIDGRSSRQKLIDACSFPLLQDTKEAKVWDRLLGSKDDHYIYTPESVLDRYYDTNAGQRVDPISVAGKASLREALMAAGA